MIKPVQVKDKLTNDFLDDRNIMTLIGAVRNGLQYAFFKNLVKTSPFTIQEWSNYLHLSERTIQRYKKEKKTFNPLHSQKILEIALLYLKGLDVFVDSQKFNTWLESQNIALGGIKPKDLLDNTFGINMIKDELSRIEHGVLA